MPKSINLKPGKIKEDYSLEMSIVYVLPTHFSTKETV